MHKKQTKTRTTLVTPRKIIWLRTKTNKLSGKQTNKKHTKTHFQITIAPILLDWMRGEAGAVVLRKLFFLFASFLHCFHCQTWLFVVLLGFLIFMFFVDFTKVFLVFELLRLGFVWFYLGFICLSTYWPADPAKSAQPSQPSRWLAGWLVGWLVGVDWLVGWLAGRSLTQQAPRACPLTFNKDLIKKRKGIGPGNSRSVSLDF